MRITHGDHWAEVDEGPYTWGQRNKIRDAVAGDEFYGGFAVTLVSCRVKAWSYDTDPSDPESWEAVDDAFGDEVFAGALKTWKRTPDPNASSGKSGPSPEVPQSETPSKS